MASVSCARMVRGNHTWSAGEQAQIQDSRREVCTYLAREFSYSRNWLPLLVAHGGRALPVPGLQLLDALQVEEGSEASAVILDHREVLVLDRAAHLGRTAAATSDHELIPQQTRLPLRAQGAWIPASGGEGRGATGTRSPALTLGC